MHTRILGLIVMSGVGFAAAPSPQPFAISPRLVTYAPPATPMPLAQAIAQIRQESGIAVTVDPAVADSPMPSVSFPAIPFWSALERITTATQTRLVMADHGQHIRLVKRTGSPMPVAVHGPFRVAVRQIESRHDFETGSQLTLVTLAINWEPRFPVIRLDGEPTRITAEDDLGSSLRTSPSSAKVAPLGYQHTTTVRLLGVPRRAARITRLNGVFTVTAAPGMLPFAFTDLTQPGMGTLPPGIDTTAVSARLVRFEKLDDRWEAEISTTYPLGHPEFESFESWTANNRAQLIGPDGTKRLRPIDFEINEVGRTATGICRFRAADLPQGPTGWKLVYDTPAALREYPVTFELRDIPLP